MRGRRATGWLPALLATALSAAAASAAAPALLALRSRGGRSARQGAEEVPVGFDMRKVVMDRAREQLAAAKAAEMQSEVSAAALAASQQQLAAEEALESAETAAEADRSATFDAQAALEETTRYALEAQHHAAHAKELLSEFDKVPKEAAAEAVAAMRDQLRRDAYASAQASAATFPAEAAARRKAKVVEDVAAAMEPYHFAVLRAQKQLATTQEKARQAARAANRLHAESIRLAQNAQRLQGLGMPGEAAEVMIAAHSASQEGVNMREWAQLLQSQAEQLQSTVPAMQGELQQAAVAAAARSGGEVVPQLPAAPPCAVAAGPAPAPAPAN